MMLHTTISIIRRFDVFSKEEYETPKIEIVVNNMLNIITLSGGEWETEFFGDDPFETPYIKDE